VVKTIFYKIANNLYVNITNACPCDCIFCIRKEADGMNAGESLWLEREPELDEIKSAFDDFEKSCGLQEIEQIVFCGFGEPMERSTDVIELARYFKETLKSVGSTAKIRLNTNGLGCLINPDFDMRSLVHLDSVSVSLNADDADEYLRITRPRYGSIAYNEMLNFAVSAKKYTSVAFSIVDVLPPERLENCRNIAKELGIPLRIR
jgi:TatD family-associated radical SAM protein